MFNPIEEIKNRLNIVDVIGGYIKLQKVGQNFRALCPFHSEKTPSFFVSPSRQMWYCFGGCSEGGDIFKFVMKIEGIEFGDALRLLAQKAGIELKKQDPKIKSERQRLYEICELTTKFFEKQLEQSKIGREAKKYLLSRKISEASLKKWRLGYAPDVWQGLSDFLSSQGYSREEIKKAGLGLSSERGSFYDRFRGRIIFPIFDLNSNIVGFTGRVFKNKDKAETAKYVNTPQSLLYDKSRVLYGLDKAKTEIRRKNACILVEGNIDLIMVHQYGFENAVAVSGTALTSYQLNILKRYSDNLLIAFDMDAAGQTAVKRGIDLAQSQGFNIKVVVLPEGKDPAEIISKDPKKWEKALDSAKTILDFYFETAFAKFDKTKPDGKMEISKALLPAIKRIPNKIVQAHWIQELAKKLNLKEETIEAELKRTKIEPGYIEEITQPSFSRGPEIKNKKSRMDLLEERIVSLILKSPSCLGLVQEKKIIEFSPQLKKILFNLKKDPNFSRKNKDPEINDLLNYLLLKSEIETQIGEKEIASEVQRCLKEISSMKIKDKLDQLSQDIKTAEQEKNQKKIEQLTQEFIQTAKEKCQN